MSGVEIRVRSNSTQARQDLGKLQKSVGNIEQSTKRLQSAFNKIAIGGAAFLSIASFTKGITRASDSITNMENKIALVTGRGRELNSTMQSLARVSSQTRVSFSTTAETFNRFGLALQGSGTSAKELLNVTRTINQAVTISGASSESARAAIVQFGQGLASGQLRGQELNSVLEQTPRIARAIADGIGIPFGQLRDAAAEGKLTTEAVLKAIQKAAPEIAQEFTLIEKTVDSVSNALRFQLLGALNVIARSTGWSNAVITGIENLTKGLKYFTDNAEITFMLYKLRAAVFISDIKKTFEPLTNIFTVEFDPAAAAENLKSNFNKFLNQAKNIITFEGFYDENTKQFDFSAFFGQFTLPPSFEENFNKAAKGIDNFIVNIKRLYNTLFGKNIVQKVPGFQEKIIPASLDTEVLEEDVNLFQKFLDKLTEFSGEAIGRILNLTETLRPLFESIGDGIRSVSSTIKTTIDGLGGYDGILEKNSNALKTYYDRLNDIVGLDVKAGNLKESMLNLIPEDNTDLTKRIREQSKKIQDALLGEEVLVNPYEEGRTKRIGGSLENAFKFLDQNKGLLAAAAVGGGLAIVFPETTAAALQLAAIGAGLAFVSLIQGAFSRGLPVLLTFGSYQAFMKGVADDPERQKEIEELSKGIVDSLQEAFLGVDQEGSSKIVDNIGAFLSSVGKGIISGLFEGTEFNNNFINAFAGALAIAVPLFILSGRGLGAMAGLGLHLVGKIFKNNIIRDGLIRGLTLGLADPTAIVTDKSKKQMRAIGSKLIGAMFVGGIFLSFKDELEKGLENIEISLGLDPEAVESNVGKALNSAAIGALGGLATAMTAGVKHPIVLLAAGLGGAIINVFSDPEIRSAFQDLGKEIYAGFRGAIFGEEYTGGDPKAVADSVKAQEATKSTIQLKQSELGAAEKQLIENQNLFKGAEQSLQNLIDAENQLKQSSIGNKGLLAANRVAQDRARADIIRAGLLVSNTAADIKRLSDAIGTLQSTIKPENLDISLPPIINKNDPNYGYYLDGQKFKAAGGMITGAGGPKDDKIPHMLSNGEYVIQASAVKKFGPSFMDALNKGQVPQFKNKGGLAGEAIFGGLSASSLSLIQFMSGEEAAKLKAIAGVNFTGKDYFEKVMGDKDSDVLNYLNEHAPDLSPALSINVKDEDSLKELIALVNKETGTNPSNINAIQEHLIRRGTLKSTKDAYNSPDGFYKGLSVLANQLGIEFPQYDNLRTIPKALMTTANLASAAIGGGGRWKSDQYRPLVRGWEKGLYGPEGDDITGFGPELRKAFFNGLPLAPEGAAYGASFGALKGLSSTILGTFKGIGNIVLGTINRDPKRLLSGALGFGSSVVRTGLGLSSIPVQAALYGLLGGTMYTAMGGLDYLLSGNRTYMGNARDLNMFKKKATRDDRDHPMIAPSNYSTMRSGLDFTDFDSFKNKFSKIDLSFLNKEQKRQAAIDVSGYDLNYLLRHYNLVRESFQRPSGREKVGLNSTSIDNTWQGKVIPNYYETLDHPFLDIQTKEPKLTDSLDEFLQAYNVGLHEYGHVNQFLNMAKENSGYGKTDFDYISTWPFRINRTVLEADANSFLKQTSLADIEDTLKTLRASQTSYMASAMANGTLTPKALKDSLEVTELKEFEDFYEAFLEGNKTIGGNSQRAIIKFLYNRLGIKDRMKASFEANKFATGGYVTGEGGPTDDKIPAMLSNKEFVVNAKQTSKFRPILEAINSGMVAGFQGGTNFAGRANIGGVVTKQANTVDAPLQSVKATKAVSKAIEEIDKQLASFNITLLEAELQLKTSTDQTVLKRAQELKMFVLNQKIIPLNKERKNLQEQLEKSTSNLNNTAKAATKSINNLSAAQLKFGKEVSEKFREEFQESFRKALYTGDFMKIDLLDMFTRAWLDSFSAGFTDSLFKSLDKKDNLGNIFGGATKFGEDIVKISNKGVTDSLSKTVDNPELTETIDETVGETGFFGNLFETIKSGALSLKTKGYSLFTTIFEFFKEFGKTLFDSVNNFLTSMQGIGTGGGGFGSLFQSFGSLFQGFNISSGVGVASGGLGFFMNDGGIVPHTPYSRTGVDSVPAMLTPGELVVPANKVQAFENRNSNQQSVVNLSITGDVSRQTRQEIVKMLPQISAGVNATNKENNFKYRR